MKVALTGGAGFIGRAVAASGGGRRHDIQIHAGLAGTGGGIECAIDDCDGLSAVFAGVDEVIHLAGPSSVAKSFELPLDHVHDHVVGTAAVIESCRRAAVRRLIYVSSAEVYGATGAKAVSETQAVAPRSPYGAAKAGAEALVGAAMRAGQFDRAIILRPFSVYGPGMRPTSVLGRLMSQVKSAEPMRVFDARPVRDYVHVEDVADAIWRSIERGPDGLTVLNICSGTGTSVADLARLLAEIGGANPQLREEGEDRPKGADIDRLVGDPRQALASIGYEPSIRLDHGLGSTLAHWPASD